MVEDLGAAQPHVADLGGSSVNEGCAPRPSALLGISTQSAWTNELFKFTKDYESASVINPRYVHIGGLPSSKRNQQIMEGGMKRPIASPK
jgi:hypothetical protein